MPESSSKPEGDESVSDTQNSLDPLACLPADTQERRIRYAGYCSSNEEELEANFDSCERSTCAASGGGIACAEKSKWILSLTEAKSLTDLDSQHEKPFEIDFTRILGCF